MCITPEQIVSLRYITSLSFYEIVYAWEDVIAKEMNIPIVGEHPLVDKRWVKNIPFLPKMIQTGKPSLIFEMNPRLRNRANNKKNIIPYIIDFHVTDKRIHRFPKQYANNPVVLISNKEAVVKLQNLGLNKKGHFKHLALSIPDNWRISPDTHFEKKVDIIIGVGRNSPVLEEYLKRYITEHPDMTYATPREEDGKRVFYTNKGEYLGLSKTREEYQQLIRMARCFLYSTPGIDGGEVRSKGYNQVTPRFLEHIASGCNPVLRYKTNPDTDYYELEKFCPSINTYEEFSAIMDKARNTEPDMSALSAYLEKHYTSTRVRELRELLRQN